MHFESLNTERVQNIIASLLRSIGASILRSIRASLLKINWSKSPHNIGSKSAQNQSEQISSTCKSADTMHSTYRLAKSNVDTEIKGAT